MLGKNIACPYNLEDFLRLATVPTDLHFVSSVALSKMLNAKEGPKVTWQPEKNSAAHLNRSAMNPIINLTVIYTGDNKAAAKNQGLGRNEKKHHLQ